MEFLKSLVSFLFEVSHFGQPCCSIFVPWDTCELLTSCFVWVLCLACGFSLWALFGFWGWIRLWPGVPVSWRMSSSTPWGPSTRRQWYSPKLSQPKYLQIWPNVPLSRELLLGKSQSYSWVFPFQEPHPCPATLCCGAQGHPQSPALREV